MNAKSFENLFLPLVLILTGVFVLAGANWGIVSLDRTKDLWPAAMILVGLVELSNHDFGKQGGSRD